MADLTEVLLQNGEWKTPPDKIYIQRKSDGTLTTWDYDMTFSDDVEYKIINPNTKEKEGENSQNFPKRIWLNYPQDDNDDDYKNLNCAQWHTNKQTKNDIEYVLVGEND